MLTHEQDHHKSDMFPWEYELDHNAPVVRTRDQLMNLAESHNKTVGIEKVRGQMMLVNHANKKQVGIMKGEIEQWAEDNYPDEVMRKDEVLKGKAVRKLTHYLDHGNFDDYEEEVGFERDTLTFHVSEVPI